MTYNEAILAKNDKLYVTLTRSTKDFPKGYVFKLRTLKNFNDDIWTFPLPYSPHRKNPCVHISLLKVVNEELAICVRVIKQEIGL